MARHEELSIGHLKFGKASPSLKGVGRKVLECLHGVLGFADVGVPVSLGKLPAGAKIVKCECSLSAAFNGTGPAVTLGYSDDTDALMGAAAITEATPGTYLAFPNATLTAEKEVVADFEVSSGTPSTGAAQFLVYYTF